MLGRFLESLVDDARTISSGMSDEFVAVEHLVLALARDERFGKGLMADLGITYANLEAAVITLRRGENVTDQDAEDKYEALKKYSRDLTEGGVTICILLCAQFWMAKTALRQSLIYVE